MIGVLTFFSKCWKTNLDKMQLCPKPIVAQNYWHRIKVISFSTQKWIERIQWIFHSYKAIFESWTKVFKCLPLQYVVLSFEVEKRVSLSERTVSALWDWKWKQPHRFDLLEMHLLLTNFSQHYHRNQTPNWLQCTELNWKNFPSSDKHLIQIEFGSDSELVPIFNSLSSHCSFNWMVHCFSAFCWIYGACARIHRLLLEIAIVESSH